MNWLLINEIWFTICTPSVVGYLFSLGWSISFPYLLLDLWNQVKFIHGICHFSSYQKYFEPFGFPAVGTCCSVSCVCLIPNAHFLSGRGCLKARHHKYFLYNTKLMFCRAEVPGAESWDFCLPILKVNVCAVWKVTSSFGTSPLAVDQIYPLAAIFAGGRQIWFIILCEPIKLIQSPLREVCRGLWARPNGLR